MKKFQLIALVALLSITPIFQSCLNTDSDEDMIVTCPDSGLFSMGTVKIPDANMPRDFYFALDNGAKLFPGDTTLVKNYIAIDNQRVFVGYLRMEGLISGFDVNGRIFSLENILTKDIIALTKENADSIGNDDINLTTRILNEDFLTLEYQYFGSGDKNKKHMLNLVENLTDTKDSDQEYVCLEFRHNAYDDPPLKAGPGVVSFKLENIREQMKGKKGLKIRVKTIYDGVQDYKVDF